MCLRNLFGSDCIFCLFVIVLILLADNNQHSGCNNSSDCGCGCGSCGGKCEHTKMDELLALMTYMANHNTAHANELAGLAKQLQEMGSYAAYEQVLAAVSDYEKGNLRLRAVLASLQK